MSKRPNQSGLVLTGGGKAGGASILSGVEQARSSQAGASPLEIAFGAELVASRVDCDTKKQRLSEEER